MGAWRRTIGLLLLAGVAPACGPAPRRVDLVPDPRAATLVWPHPPAAPRVRFLASVERPRDLGIRPSVWKRLRRSLSGEKQARFVRPSGVAVRGARIYVADPGSGTLWFLDPEAGRSRRIRSVGPQPLVSPVAVAVGSDDRVYLADSFLAKVFVFGPDGKPVHTLEGPELRRPAGVACDAAADRIYVADSAAHRIHVFAGDGTRQGSIGGRGDGEGEFNFPTHVAVDGGGNLLVTDAMGFRVQIFARDGRFVGAFGHHGDGSGDFAAPKGVAADGNGHVYVVDALFDTVQLFDRDGRFLLSFGERGVGLGQFWLPSGLFIDPRGRIYVADSYNRRVQIFEYVDGSFGG